MLIDHIKRRFETQGLKKYYWWVENTTCHITNTNSWGVCMQWIVG